MSSRKQDILLSEAENDIAIRNYNKAVSAIYFALRKEVEEIIQKLGFQLPRRDDKLANIIKHLGFDEEALIFMKLYELRKKADYADESIEEKDVKKALELVRKVIAKLKILERRN